MKIFYFLIIGFTIFSCKNDISYYEDDGIWIENLSKIQIDSSINKYNYDNVILKPNVEYIYDYYQLRKGKKVKYSAGGSEYIDYSTPDNSTIMEFGIQTMIKNGFMDISDDYTQSVIQFNMYDIDGEQSFGKSQTGVIENARNLWIHPIRHGNFRILEMNPFPFIKSPYKIGNKYNWKLRIGDHWADPNWKVWTGGIENQMTYEITSKTNIETKAGKFEAFVIDAKGNSRIGETKLRSYFNKKVGFVKHEYFNIDSSKLIIELIKIREIKFGCRCWQKFDYS